MPLPWLARRGTASHLQFLVFLSSVIPAEAGIQRPETRRSPLDSRFRGNDGNIERSENPNAIALARAKRDSQPPPIPRVSLLCHSRGSGNPAPRNPSLAPGFPLARE